MLNILIAEDNDDLRGLIKLRLTRAGYNVLEASDGVEALELLDHNMAHLMIIDVMMPRMDGYQLASMVRETDDSLPIIFVTARESLEDKRSGFANGADDYMVKPIDIDELLMRIKALLRRANISGEHVLRIGSCTVDENTMTLTCGDKTLELRQKEFRLLHLMLSYPGKIFTRHELMDEIWGYDNESDFRTVDVHIKRLRDKVAGISDFEVQTVRGIGYKAVLKQ